MAEPRTIQELLSHLTRDRLDEQLNFLSRNQAFLTLPWSASNEDPLAILDPSNPNEFVPYLCILHVRLNFSKENTKRELKWALRFASCGIPPIATTPSILEEVSNICRLVAHVVNYDLAHLVCSILIRFAKSWASTFSLAHFLAISQCLEFGFYDDAASLLDVPITDFDASGMDIVHYLGYHYYGGLIYLALQNFAQAKIFFNLVLYAPGTVASGAQVEAYKKLILTGLLTGKQQHLPSQMNSTVKKTLETLVRNYLIFEEVFLLGDLVKIEQVVQKNRPTFEEDGSMGLIFQCIDSLVTKKIQKLTKTYLTLSITDIETMVGSPDMPGLRVKLSMEAKLCQMIERGEIDASISHKHGGMVSFNDPKQVNVADVLRSKTKVLIQENDRLSDVNHKIGSSATFIEAAFTRSEVSFDS